VKFNEDSRVKIPAILNLTRLSYTYLSLKGLAWDESSNIVPSLFCQSVSAINPSATSSEIEVALSRNWFLPMLMNGPVTVRTNER
jgi:type I restriction enzyme R subunit